MYTPMKRKMKLKKREKNEIKANIEDGELDLEELEKVSGGFWVAGSVIGYKVVTTAVGAMIAAVAVKYGYTKANEAVCDKTGNPLPFATCD